MKKILGILAIMFTFVITSFSQNEINGTMFNLTVDGVPSTDFMVTYNSQDQFNTMGPGVLLVLFNNPMDIVDFQGNDAISINYIEDVVYTEPKLGIGIKAIKVDYHTINMGEINIVTTSFDEDIYLATKFNTQDTLNSWNMGMEIGIEYGFKEGITSVDTMKYYNMGIESIDTMKYYNMGIESIDTETIYNTGIASVNIDSIYQSGVNSVVIPECNLSAAYYEGQMSVNTDSVDVFYEIGFADGQVKAAQTTTNMKSTTTTDIGLSAYPNPVDNGTDVYVSCFDFLKVDVYNLSGTKMFTTKSQYVSTNNLTEGVYVFVVWDRNNNTDITKIIVK